MTTPIVPSITDEQLDAIEAQASKARAHGVISGINIHPDALVRLVARLRSAEKDAGRYRWLRERSGVLPEDCKTIWVLRDGCSMTDLERQETDQAIDTAMEQQP